MPRTLTLTFMSGARDGEPFEEKMQRLAATLRRQQTEAAKLDAAIAANLKALGFWTATS